MSASRKINSFAFYYFNKDHLGNIREVVDTEGLIHHTNKNAMIGGAANIANGKSFGAVEQDVTSAFGHTTGTYFKLFGRLGVIAGVANIGYTAIDLRNNIINSNSAGIVRNVADLTMTAVGFMGPVGSIASATYFIGTAIYDNY